MCVITMQIKIDENITLDKIKESDFDNLVKYLNDKEISDNTLVIPFPYSHTDAKWWKNHLDEFETKHNTQKGWIIRHINSGAIGGISLNYNTPHGVSSHKNEIGYWLAKPFWNHGIMSKVVTTFTDYCFNTLKFERIEAPIFHWNISSEKVLEKSGFQLEGILKNYTKKGSQLIDVKMYSKLKKKTPHTTQG